MMSYRLLNIIIVSSTCIQLLACATPQPTPITSPIKTSQWETRLPGEQSSIKITFTLPQHAKAELQLFNGKPRHINAAQARITLSDENCSSGHLTAINHQANRSERLTQYFAKEAPWNNTNTLILAWDTNNRMTTTLNGDTLTTELASKVTSLKIVSTFAPINIQQIEYTP